MASPRVGLGIISPYDAALVQHGARMPIRASHYDQAVHRFREAQSSAGDPRVVYNRNYYNNSIGQAELRQRQQIDAETQLRDLQHELLRQSQTVQVGGQVLTPQQRAEMQQVSQDSLAAINSLQPFIQTGMLDAESIRKVVGQAATDSLTDQRTRRKMEGELQELWTAAHKTGGFSVEQSQGVMKQMIERYGVEKLGNSKLGAKILGIEKQIADERETRKAQYAQKIGVTSDDVVWDERNNQVTLGPAFNDRATVTAVKAAEMAPQIEAAQVRRQDAGRLYEQESRVAHKFYESRIKDGEDPEVAMRELNAKLNRAYRQYQITSGAVEAPSNASPAQQAAADRLAKVREQAAALVQKYPKLPKGSRFMGEKQDIVSAGRSTPPNSYVAVEGRLFYRNATGQFSEVR